MMFTGASAQNPNSNYLWIAVGASGNLSTSTSSTASSWTSRTSSFSTTKINQVRAGGDGYFVAVGDSGKLATSKDGITWTQRTSGFGSTNINDVGFANGVWCAVGDTGKMFTATDPTGTWTSRTSGLAVGINGISYGNGLWAINGAGGEIRTATDPTGTWTGRTSTLTRSNGRIMWNPIQSVWVCGIDDAATGALASSPDGITWTARNLPNTPGSTINGRFAIGRNANIIVCFYILAAGNYDVATSTDGATWTDRTPTGTGWGGSPPCNISTDEFGLMVSYNGANMITSTDGITWTARTAPAFTIHGICHNSEI
jgi:photosystem II stability/assembly factor-like uncharacterized protein